MSETKKRVVVVGVVQRYEETTERRSQRPVVERALRVSKSTTALKRYLDIYFQFDSIQRRREQEERTPPGDDLCRRIMITFSSFSSFPWVSPFVVSQELVCGARRRRRLRRRRLV